MANRTETGGPTAALGDIRPLGGRRGAGGGGGCPDLRLGPVATLRHPQRRSPRFIYLPAWIVVVDRRRRKAVRCSPLPQWPIVVAADRAPGTRSSPRPTPLPGWASRSAAPSRLLDANVYEPESVDGRLRRHRSRSFHPTLVTMEEATPNRRGPAATGRGARRSLPYRIEVRRFDQKAFLVASSYPLAGFRTIWFADQPFVVETSIVLPSGTYPLWVVHTSAPLPADFGAWKQQLALLGRAVAPGAPGAPGVCSSSVTSMPLGAARGSGPSSTPA